MKKIISVLLCSALLFTASYTNFSLPLSEADADGEAGGAESGTADIYTDTAESWLVKEGESEYKILYPAGMSEKEYDAVEELTTLFYDATGVYLECVDDGDVFVFLRSYTYISVGNTRLAELARISYDSEEVGPQGYHLETKANSLFIMSDGYYGLIYGVYRFLEEQFGYDYYAKGEWDFDKPTDNCRLVRLNVNDKPDILWRSVSYQEQNDAEYARRMRMHQTREAMLTTSQIGSVHNTLNYVETILSYEHPVWFSTTGDQLCYSRDVEGLSDYIAAKMEALLTENPDVDCLTLTQMDNGNWCNCSTCRGIISSHGNYATSTQILFINVLARKLKAWAEENYPGREITLGFFAYWQTIDAPVKSLGGKYVPVSDDMILEDNVAVYYAPLAANYFYPFDDTRVNGKFYLDLEKWSALADKFFFWPYGSNFGNYFLPFNLFNSIQSLYRVARQYNTVYFFDQIQMDNRCGVDWARLKIYLQSKLAWDADADLEYYIGKFFAHYFGDASTQMRSLFDQMRAWTVWLASEHGLNIGYTTGGSTDPAYWPEVMLKGWMNIIEDAYKAIDYLQVTDPERYETLGDRICLESLPIRELYRIGYGSRMSSAALEKYKREFLTDCRRLGVNRYSENWPVENYYNNYA